jgi:hypothetical protein
VLSATSQLRTLAIAVAGILVITLVVKLAWAVLGIAFRRHLRASAPRPQYGLFVLTLRDRLFADPFTVMSCLWSGHHDDYVRRLWDDLARQAAGLTADLQPPRDGPIPSDTIRVQRMQLADGRPLAVISLPPPRMTRETYMVGVILPWDDSLKTDRPRARRQLRYFVLFKWHDGGPRTSDLCEWTIDHDEPRELTYNIGAPPNPVGFAKAIEAKLHELRR